LIFKPIFIKEEEKFNKKNDFFFGKIKILKLHGFRKMIKITREKNINYKFDFEANLLA